MKTVVKDVISFEKKRIAKEINILERSDLEQAISNFMGKAVSVADVECILTYFIDVRTGEFDGMTLDFTVGEEMFDSIDLFYDSDAEGHVLKGMKLCLDEPWLRKEDVFDFEISLFKHFETAVERS